MKQQTITLACALSAEEYQRFKAICEQKSTYPSAAIREAVMEWMERKGVG
jgi:predicted DNA-binding protein